MKTNDDNQQVKNMFVYSEAYIDNIKLHNLHYLISLDLESASWLLIYGLWCFNKAEQVVSSYDSIKITLIMDRYS